MENGKLKMNVLKRRGKVGVKILHLWKKKMDSPQRMLENYHDFLNKQNESRNE